MADEAKIAAGQQVRFSSAFAHGLHHANLHGTQAVAGGQDERGSSVFSLSAAWLIARG